MLETIMAEVIDLISRRGLAWAFVACQIVSCKWHEERHATNDDMTLSIARWYQQQTSCNDCGWQGLNKLTISVTELKTASLRRLYVRCSECGFSAIRGWDPPEMLNSPFEMMRLAKLCEMGCVVCGSMAISVLQS